MLLAKETIPYIHNSNNSDGFEEFRRAHELHQPTEAERRRYGHYAIENTSILETPSSVLECGEVLTNPSQIETALVLINGELTAVLYAYFRREPTRLHLGKTESWPYLLRRNKRGEVYLYEFAEAAVLLGEDPRVIPNVKIAGPTGKVYNGCMVSTVVATPMPDNPADVQRIEQVFHWGPTSRGKDLSELEPIHEIEGLKNTNPFPMSNITGDDLDTRLDAFGRPHPRITHIQVPSFTDITKERILSGTEITKGFLPPNTHVGVNNVKAVPGCPNLRDLDIHEAWALVTPEGKILHYWLGRYIVDLSTGRLMAMGNLATRADFPEADPKPPENSVKDFRDVLYGSMGNPRNRMMVTGVSDRHVGLARVIRVR